MPLDTFDRMSLSEKYTYISDHGKYIGVRSYYNYFINLHIVDEMFYEVCYFRPDNKIEKIEVLGDIKKIDLYIKYMSELDKSSL